MNAEDRGNDDPALEEDLVAQKRWRLLAVTLAIVNHAHAAEGDVQARPPVPRSFSEAATGMEMVYVESGCFQMGDVFGDGVSGSGQSTDELPVHEVCVNGFYIGKFEVTQAQWKSIMGSNPSTDGTCKAGDCPVDNVSWKDVQEFIARLNRKGGAGTFRLPTEAEWEYAARSGGKNERYSGGNDVDSVSWYQANSASRGGVSAAHPVGTKAPNGLGIHDMSGNVYELTSDWYGSTYYSSSPRDDPRGPGSGSLRVERGGCSSGHPGNSRTTRRSKWSDASGGSGLRLVRVP